VACLMLPRVHAADQAAADAPDARVRETITRLAADASPSARDWRELADRTLVYGTGARMNQQPVEQGAVHDALAAVDRGEAADPKLTDWKKLRADLQALLDTPPQEQQQQPQDQKQDEQQKQEKQDQSQQQQQDQSSQSQDQQQQNQQQQQQTEQQNQSSPQQQPAKPQDGAMGDLKNPDQATPPPPPENPPEPNASQPKTRKIGARPTTETPPPTDAETALLLQRMREAADKDSPARLFQLLEGDAEKPAARGKDW